jgi:hypothetical protein
MPLDSTEVVRQTEVQPLSVDLFSGAKTEALEAMRVADVGKYRLHTSEARAALKMPFIGIDLASDSTGTNTPNGASNVKPKCSQQNK